MPLWHHLALKIRASSKTKVPAGRAWCESWRVFSIAASLDASLIYTLCLPHPLLRMQRSGCKSGSPRRRRRCRRQGSADRLSRRLACKDPLVTRAARRGRFCTALAPILLYPLLRLRLASPSSSPSRSSSLCAARVWTFYFALETERCARGAASLLNLERDLRAGFIMHARHWARPNINYIFLCEGFFFPCGETL